MILFCSIFLPLFFWGSISFRINISILSLTFGGRFQEGGGSGRAFVSGAPPHSFFGQIKRHWDRHRMCMRPVAQKEWNFESQCHIFFEILKRDSRDT